MTYRVLHESDEPVCQVPYSCLTKGFGSKWVVIAEDSVQLVGDWTPRQVINGAELARSFARERYERIAKPGSESPVAKSTPNQQVTPSKTAKKRTVSRQGGTQHIIRRVVRDKNGCFMGVYALHEAKKIWEDAKLDSSLIVVPRTISFEEASNAISASPNLETPFTAQQYRSAIRSACLLPPKLVSRDAAQFWAALSDTKLNVFNDMSIAIGRLTPGELDAMFGTNWFLASLTAGQVMSNLTSSAIQIRLKVAQQRSTRGAAEQSKSDTKAMAPNVALAAARPKQKLSSNMFYVIRSDGKIAYQCKKKKSEPLMVYLKRLLPGKSYKYTSVGFQLTQSLESLGFRSPQEFTKACAVACRGDKPEVKRPPTSSQAKAAVPTATKTVVIKGTQQKKASKGVAKVALGRVSFDGPEHVLYVSKKCAVMRAQRPRGRKCHGQHRHTQGQAGRHQRQLLQQLPPLLHRAA